MRLPGEIIQTVTPAPVSHRTRITARLQRMTVKPAYPKTTMAADLASGTAGAPGRESRRRQARLVGTAALITVVALGGTWVAEGAASAATTPQPPSWLDLAAQIGQIANSQSGTAAALLAVDATIRDSLNGTASGYVYDLASDAAQMVPTLKDLVKDGASLARDWGQAHSSAEATESYWKEERQIYQDEMVPLMRSPSIPCYQAPPGNQQCLRVLARLQALYDKAATPTSPPLLSTVGGAASRAITMYTYAERSLGSVLTAAGDLLLEARATEGDAKDYPGNKEVEAVVQVIGEHRIASSMAKVVARATGLGPHLEAQVTEMVSCKFTGAAMDVMSDMAPPPAYSCAPS